MDDDAENFAQCEQTVLQIYETFVYKADTKLKVSIFAYRDPTKLLASDENLAKFAECPIEVEPKGDITPFVDAVIDSSRYYVLRIKDPASSRSTLLGIGFREREVSFDFKNVLNEYVRYVDRMYTAKTLAERRAAGDDSADRVDLGGAATEKESQSDDPETTKISRDLTLKDKISIPLPGVAQNVKRREIKIKSFGSYGSIAPPPPPGSTVFSSLPQLPTVPGSPTLSTDDGDDDGWGEFTEA